jgi:hypothetical protein
MSEPLRTENADLGPLTDTERAARIEQLLLSGLDHYFAGRYEHAINVWTRVSFLERGHGRARAYIERARSALAEMQRESEALLHEGVEAYQAGDLPKARELLTRALQQGGANDQALAFLQRVDVAADATATSARLARSTLARPARPVATGSPRRWLSTLAACILVVSLVILGALRTASWIRERPLEASVTGLAPIALPVIRESEAAVARARALFTEGRGVEALRVLDDIEIGDAMRAEADRLTAEIQRALLSAAASERAAQIGEAGR